MTKDVGGVPEDHSTRFDDPKTILKARLEDLETRRGQRSGTYRMYLVVGVFLISLTPFLYFLLPKVAKDIASLISLAYGIATLALAIRFSPRELDEQKARVEDELELLAIQDTSREQRAQKLLKLHQSELKRYYDQTLRQTSVIFFAGLVCIFLGFAVVGGSLYIVRQTPASDIQEKLILGGLGTIGGILANFVAVMYLRMFTQTVSSLTEFHNRLVSTHNLYFGNFLMSKMDKDSNLYEKVLSEIAAAVSRAPYTGVRTHGTTETESNKTKSEKGAEAEITSGHKKD